MGSAPPTKAAKFARKCDKVFESTAIALYAKKTMFQQTASKVTAEFFMDKSWQRNVRIRKMGLE